MEKKNIIIICVVAAVTIVTIILILLFTVGGFGGGGGGGFLEFWMIANIFNIRGIYMPTNRCIINLM